MSFSDNALVALQQNGLLNPVRITDFMVVNSDDTALSVRVCASFSTEPETAVLARQQIATACNNSLSVIPNTFRRIRGTNGFNYVGWMSPNAEIRSYNPHVATAGGYRVLSKNVLMDNRDSSTWEIRDTKAGKVITRTSNQDLSELLAVATVATRATSSADPRLATVISTAGVQDYVAYLDSHTCQIGFGYVVSASAEDVTVIPRNKDVTKPVSIANYEILTAASLKGADTAGFTRAPSMSLLDYYRILYQHRPDYFAEVEQRIMAQGVM